MNNTPLLLKPADYDHHPLLRRMAMESEVITYLTANEEDREDLERRESARRALIADIKANGVLERAKVVKGANGRWLLAEGRHRGDACAILGIPLPVEEITEEEARKLIFSTFVLTRPRSKGAKAWLQVNLHPEIANSKQGPKGNSDSIGISREGLAEAAGISPDLIDQACSLYNATQKVPRLRPQIDAAIAAGKGLGALVAGLAGAEALPTGDNGKPTRPAPSLNSYCRTLKTIGTQLGHFAQWGEVDQAEAVEQTAAILRGNESARALFTAALAAADAAPEADDAEPACHTCQGSGKWPSAGGRIVKCPSCKGGTKQPDAPEADAT
jgi:hypothetical protein